MMFLNSGIFMVNFSMVKKRILEVIKKNFFSLFNEKEDLRVLICEICGRRYVRIKFVYCFDFLFVGIGGVLNYFFFGKDGVNICFYCLFLVQMMLLVVYRFFRVFIIYVYLYQLMFEFYKEVIEDIKKSEFVFIVWDFKRFENFLFEKFIEIGMKFEIGKFENVLIMFYYFVNNNQS